MKSMEIVQEGPFLNKLASAVKGAGAGYRSNQGRRVADEATAASAKRAHTRWNAQESALIGKGVKPEQLPGYLDRYIQTHFDPQQTGSMKSFPKFSGAYNDTTVLAHLTKAVQQLATSELDNPTPAGTTTPAATASTTAPATPATASTTAPATPATAPATPATASTTAPATASTTAPATPATAPATAGTTTPAATAPATPATAVPVVSAALPIFKDPTAFKSEWDTFVASKPNYRLIADPALLSVLKNMWMRSGGIKAESSNNGTISGIHIKESPDRIEPTMDAPVAEPMTAPQPAPVTEPVVPVSVFADPKKLAYDFESFMQAGGKIPPAMRGILKDILLTALRTVESRQRKLNRIVSEAKFIQRELASIKKQKPL